MIAPRGWMAASATGGLFVKKFILLAFIAGTGLAATPYAQAMTVAPPDRAQSSMTIKIAGGCGIGFHPGPNGGCRPNRAAVVVVPGAVVVEPVGPCGGRGMHRVCNGLGRCWRACN